MSDRTYTPNRWVVLMIGNTPTIFGGWGGGYLHGSSWRRSTEVRSVNNTPTHYEFSCASGSTYVCAKDAYGVTGFMAQLLTEDDDVLVEQELEEFIDSLQNKGDSIGSRGTSAS